MVGIKIKRTEAAGKQRAESYDSAVPSRPGNYWLNLEERMRKREVHVFFLRASYPRPWISISLKEEGEGERERFEREEKLRRWIKARRENSVELRE